MCTLRSQAHSAARARKPDRMLSVPLQGLISSCFQSQTLWSYTPASAHIQVLKQMPPPLHLVIFSLSQHAHLLCLGAFKPEVNLLLCTRLSQLTPVTCSATIHYSHVSLVTPSSFHHWFSVTIHGLKLGTMTPCAFCRPSACFAVCHPKQVD